MEQNNNQPKLETLTKRNSVDNNLLKLWLNDVIVKNMEKTNYPRIMFLFAVVFFFLGRNLDIFCYLVIGLTIYMLIMRAIRFYLKRWLLYMCEFCYFGISGLLIFLIFFRENKTFWTSVYSYGTGNMAMAIVLFNNQALFTSSDHMSSAWLHFAPLLTCWAIRWRHTIYDAQYSSYISLEHMQLENHEILTYFVKFPLIFWACWAVTYTLLMNVVLRKYTSCDKYENGLTDYIGMVDKMAPLKKVIGDARNYTFIKYILGHFVQYLIGLITSYLCYLNFYVNTLYVVLLTFYLLWSAGRTQLKIMNKKVEKTIDKVESGNIEEKKSN